jgi:hypothetical protein
MDKQTDSSQFFDLGTWLGRKQAFGLLAGKCSAADAECLRSIREKKLYRSLQLNWDQFCHDHVGISRPVVDKIVRQLEEFGPAFFQLSGVTHITADEYRLIATSVTEEGVAWEGQRIAITIENAPRLTRAVEGLRHHAALPAPEPAAWDAGRALARAEKLLRVGLMELAKVQAAPLDVEAIMRLQSVAGSARDQLERILASAPLPRP